MQISFINNVNYNYKPVTFGVNLQSKRLQFKEIDFFVNINGYGRNLSWAKKIKETADKAAQSINLVHDFDYTLKLVVQGVKEANRLQSFDNNKYYYTGILRKPVRSKFFGNFLKFNDNLYTPYSKTDKNKYQIYADRLDFVKTHPLKNPYKDIGLTRPKYDKYNRSIMKHAHPKYIYNAFKHIKSVYDELYHKYIENEAKVENLPDINSSLAEIRWILAHATPWVRGSDAISNTLIRAIYKSMGVKTVQLKKGVSLDIEAYCTNLNDYKNKFASYFTKEPQIIV